MTRELVMYDCSTDTSRTKKKVTSLEIAAAIGNEEFVAHSSCQYLLNLRWGGKLKLEKDRRFQVKLIAKFKGSFCETYHIFPCEYPGKNLWLLSSWFSVIGNKLFGEFPIQNSKLRQHALFWLIATIKKHWIFHFYCLSVFLFLHLVPIHNYFSVLVNSSQIFPWFHILVEVAFVVSVSAYIGSNIFRLKVIKTILQRVRDMKLWIWIFVILNFILLLEQTSFKVVSQKQKQKK